MATPSGRVLGTAGALAADPPKLQDICVHGTVLGSRHFAARHG